MTDPVTEPLDMQPFGTTHRVLLGLCMAIMVIDGFDTYVLGKIAPLVAAHFGAPASALSRVFLLQQLGLAVGAFIATPLADRYGRQRMLAVATAGFALTSLWIPFAPSLQAVGMARAVAGLFLSGALPMVIALLAESIPQAKRATCISVALGAYSGGSAAGGIVAAWVVGAAGWQSAFYIGGAMPLALLPWLVWRMPESPQFLARVASVPAGRLPAGSLLRRLLEGRRWLTGVLWAMTFLSMGSIAFLGSWLPTFFQVWQGIPVQAFAVLTLVAFSGGLVGTLTSGWLLDRFPALLLLRLAYGGLAVSLWLLGHVPFAAWFFVGVLTAWNLFQSGGQALINTFLSRVYPVEVRSTGIGWAGGAGRIGGIVLPSLGGLMLERDLGLATVMSLVALAPATIFLLTFLLPPQAGRPPPRHR
jgi:AAHS family 4-hydroxybenzoate transporter-like MFS transporter